MKTMTSANGTVWEVTSDGRKLYTGRRADERRNVLIGALAALGYAIPGLQISTTADLEAELVLAQARADAVPLNWEVVQA